ncbi:MAG: tRNA (adenosine(37)-N6)-dimethylallyltransferase MiaA [Planctomycetes bacterium]|nr:tRNA (adenosine(37)-N6)-dimethylallyltransferase MiaA [Planctomycetota bacterium]
MTEHANELSNVGDRPGEGARADAARAADPAPIEPIPDAWYLTGPTASGKTQIGIELAERLGAEIISLDSMSVYRGMNIGTAKPNAEARRRCPHHLIDLVDPTAEFSVSQYVEGAHAAVREIRSRGRKPLFVGGTPLYLKALLRGIYQGPPADWAFRNEVEGEAARIGIAALHDRLALVDPLAAAQLHPNDRRRIVRALEVFHLTGRPLSHQQMQFEEGRRAEDCRVFVLGWDRTELHDRIAGRVEGMFTAGLIDEVAGLLRVHGALGRTAAQAVGYREVHELLRGDRDRASAREAVKARTRQFARRQETWFRQLSECTRIPMGKETTAEETADRIVAVAASLRASSPDH